MLRNDYSAVATDIEKQVERLAVFLKGEQPEVVVRVTRDKGGRYNTGALLLAPPNGDYINDYDIAAGEPDECAYERDAASFYLSEILYHIRVRREKRVWDYGATRYTDEL